MKSTSTLFVGLVIIAFLGLYMVTYQVGFNEVVVVRTFGKAGPDAVKRGDDPKGGFIGNLYWRWPRPIQKLARYDMRIHIQEDRLEQQQTRDKHSIITQAYVAWRITDPLAFYQSHGTVDQATPKLTGSLRDARAALGEFTFDDLTNTDPEKLRLVEAEQAILKRLRDNIARQETPWGITVEDVGIRRIILPETVTTNVFNTMKETRQRLAQSTETEGEAVALQIKSGAEAAKKKIEDFAELRAQQIRAEGAAAAAEYYRVFQQNEDFAIFLNKLKTLRGTLSNNTTFLLDTRVMPFDMFAEQAQKNAGN